RYLGESDEILSMDDSDNYGETIHKLSFKKALEHKPPILCDYKVITISISKDEVAHLVRSRSFVRPRGWKKETEAGILTALVALRKAIEKYPIRHAVSFHGSIKRAKAFEEYNRAYSGAFPKRGGLETYHVSGETPTGSRARILQNFANSQRSLITNARCLTEGVDVPSIDAVLFTDPKRSLVDIVQAVGRALRPFKGKQFGFIIVPIYVSSPFGEGQLDENNRSFKEIVATLRALGSQDERIIEYFRSIVLKRRQDPISPLLFENEATIAREVSLKAFADSLKLRIWDRIASLSWRPFPEARDYVRSLKLRTHTEWVSLCEKRRRGLFPALKDIPSNPDKAYKNQGWVSFADWVGTNRIANQKRTYLPFKKARSFARALNLKNVAEWRLYCQGKISGKPKIPLTIPKAPSKKHYREWVSFNDWLGTKNLTTLNRKFLPFKRARCFVRRLGLKSMKEWDSYCRGRILKSIPLPSNIPKKPYGYYKTQGYRGIGDWLGVPNSHFRKRGERGPWMNFKAARQFAWKKGFKNVSEWRVFCKKGGLKGLRIPACPHTAYKGKGWKSWFHWLGTEYTDFESARAFVRRLKLDGFHAWRMYGAGKDPLGRKKPDHIPLSADRYYAKQGWKGYSDFLGTFRPRGLQKKYDH
ncbi:MAG: hypothetical protein EB101_09855, partial [Chitinophagia bacterium]|nr:hypothetical protein [Chitinophagia bacterium]